MIRIRITEKQGLIRSIRFDGHALFADYGQDIVCAGVSAVVISGFNAIDEMYPDTCILKVASQNGDDQTMLQVIREKDSPELQAALKMFVLQLQCLQEGNPSYIHMQTTRQ